MRDAHVISALILSPESLDFGHSDEVLDVLVMLPFLALAGRKAIGMHLIAQNLNSSLQLGGRPESYDFVGRRQARQRLEQIGQTGVPRRIREPFP